MNAEAPQISNDSPATKGVSLGVSIAAVLLAIAVALGPVLRGGFSYWDDEDTIALNPGFHPPTWSSLADRWARPHLHIYIPLTHTVWHLVALVAPRPAAGEVGNVAAWPFKLTNLLAHGIASLLVLLVLRRLVGKTWPAIAGAMLFAIHPLQVESVAWASGLKDVLFGMFSIACVLAYIGCERDALRPRGRNVALALALLVLAGLSKPTAMVVPAMLLVIDLFFLRRPIGPAIARLIPFAVVAAVFAGFAWRLQPASTLDPAVPMLWRPIVAMGAIAFYLKKLLLPTDLAYDYGLTAQAMMSAMKAHPWRVFISGLGAVIGSGLLLRVHRTNRGVITGVLLALVAIAPVLGFTHFDFAHYSLVADHYLYLPMLGIALLAASLLARIPSRIGLPAAALIAVALAVLSFRQAYRWKDARSVTEQTLRVNPFSYASWGNLALAELRAHDLNEAERHARYAAELAPDDPQTAFIIANILQERGDFAGAEVRVRRALVNSPYAAAYHQRLAVLLGKQGKFEAALASLQRTLALDHNYPGAQAMEQQLRAFIRQESTRPTSDATSAPTTLP